MADEKIKPVFTMTCTEDGDAYTISTEFGKSLSAEETFTVLGTAFKGTLETAIRLGARLDLTKNEVLDAMGLD